MTTKYSLSNLSRINWAVILISIGILSRMGLWMITSETPSLLIQGDGISYELIARNVLEGHGFSLSTEFPYSPDRLRTPGYTLFIAGIYSIVGYRPEIVTFIQNILNLITLYIAYRLAVQLFGLKEALVAAVLMALDIGLIILANITLTEALFMVLFVPATYCLFSGLGSQHYRIVWMLTAGLLLGSAVLVRPAETYLIWLLLPFLWWALSCSKRDKAITLTILVLAYVIPLFPWAYRTWQVFGSPAPGVSTLALRAMTFNMHASYVRAQLNGTILTEELPLIPTEVRHELGEQASGSIEEDNLIQKRAIAEIMQHPISYAILYAKSVGLTLMLPNTNFLANTLGILNKPTWIIANMRVRTITENVQVLLAFSVDYLVGSPKQKLFFVALVTELIIMFITYVLALVGIIKGLKNKHHQITIVLLLVIISYFFIITGIVGTGRYRLPTMPYLMMLAGSGFVQIQSWLLNHRTQNTSLKSES